MQTQTFADLLKSNRGINISWRAWTYTAGVNEGFPTFVLPTNLGAQTIAITTPVTDAAQQTTITAGTGYTGAITWNPTSAKFAATTVYTATVTLTSTMDYQWPSTAPTITVTGQTVTSPTVSGTGAGNTLTFSVTFAETGAASEKWIDSAATAYADGDGSATTPWKNLQEKP